MVMENTTHTRGIILALVVMMAIAGLYLFTMNNTSQNNYAELADRVYGPEDQNNQDKEGPAVSSYEDCVERGYPVMESYPEQCSDGTNTFVRDVNKDKAPKGSDVVMPVESDGGIGDGAVPLGELVNPSAPKKVSLIGMTEQKARALAKENNAMFRVVTQDGEPQMVTMDYMVGRINASVTKGIVDGYAIEGGSDEQNNRAQKELFETIRELENSKPQY